MKILGLDVGSKSCGIALSDALMISAQGKENFCFELKNWNVLISHLENNYLKDVKKIVVGFPLLSSGDKSKTTHMIEEFVKELKKRVKIEIQFVEEFGTTKRAHEIMISANVSRKKRKKNKDKLAAVLILQDYLDRN